jgi:outer membrane protein
MAFVSERRPHCPVDRIDLHLFGCCINSWVAARWRCLRDFIAGHGKTARCGHDRRGGEGRALMIAVAAWSSVPASAHTLEQALVQAYRNNPQLNSQRAVVRETDEAVPQALSGYRPTVAVNGTSSEGYFSTVSKSIGPTGIPAYPRGSATFNTPSVGLTATQTLFNGFQTANKVRQAEANTSAAREALRVAEQTILLNAATVYMNLLRDSALLELNRRNVEVLQDQLRQTRDRFIGGDVTRTDVAQAEAREAQGRAVALAAEAQYALSKATYRQVIGVEAGTLVPAVPVDRLTPRRLADAIQIARARHPSVGVAMFGIDAAVLQVKINEGTLYPNVSLVGNVSQTWYNENFNELQQFAAFVQGQVNIPLYQGGAEYSLIRQAKEAVGQKRIDLEATRDLVQANVATAWAQLDAAKAQVLANQAFVASDEIALDGVRLEARLGLRTTLDVLNAVQELVNSRTALVVAQHDRVVASYTLLAAVGELNLLKLGLNIPLYDPMVHYQQIRDAWTGVRTPDGR